jgi:ribosomal protein S18 acetylase RimI-like enzyme
VNWGNEFVELDKTTHDRSSFDCDKDELNNFIKTRASKHMEVGVSKTFLLPSLKPLPSGMSAICAFYTITGATIERSDLPDKLGKKLPQYPVPVFLLGQLAVHRECAGQGLGKIVLINALSKLADINRNMPSYAVIVDCLDEQAESFYRKYGFKDLTTHNERVRMFLAMSTLIELFKN